MFKKILNRRQFLGQFLVSASAIAFVPGILRAGQGVAAKSGSSLATDAINNCLGLIRSCQLANGAINMRWERDPQNPDDRKQAIENNENPDVVKVDTLRVIPYFANHSALALLAAYSHYEKNYDDLKRVAKWTNFYAVSQNQSSGYINDYKGSIKGGTFGDSGKKDSVDTYASTFLQVADVYLKIKTTLPAGQQQELEKILPADKLINAAKLSLIAIESVIDNGLTWAKPDYKVKYLVDNAEVYGGLVAGADFFDKVGAKAEADKAKGMAANMGAKLLTYWQPQQQCFAWAIMENGAIESGLNKSYPDGLANLCGLAWISSKNIFPWQEINKKFASDTTIPAERWLMAAIAINDTDVAKWRQKVAEEGKKFNNATNGNRPALILLTLLEGRSWMPSIAEQ